MDISNSDEIKSTHQTHDQSYNNHDTSVNSSSEKKKIFMSIKIRRNNNWSKEEDEKLLYVASLYKVKNWLAAAEYIKTKNPSQCSARYKRIRPGLVKGPWSKEDDQMILKLVEIYGKNWTEISKHIPTRNSKQIRDRFLNYLDRTFKKEKFTDEEDKLLVQKYLELGSKWSKIAEHFEGRTGDMIKNRFYSCLKKKIHVYDIKPHKKVLKNYYKLKKEKIRLREQMEKMRKVNHNTDQMSHYPTFRPEYTKMEETFKPSGGFASVKMEDRDLNQSNILSLLKNKEFNNGGTTLLEKSEILSKIGDPQVNKFIENLRYIDMIRNEEIQRLINSNTDVVNSIERILKEEDTDIVKKEVQPPDTSMTITVNVNNAGENVGTTEIITNMNNCTRRVKIKQVGGEAIAESSAEDNQMIIDGDNMNNGLNPGSQNIINLSLQNPCVNVVSNAQDLPLGSINGPSLNINPQSISITPASGSQIGNGTQSFQVPNLPKAPIHSVSNPINQMGSTFASFIPTSPNPNMQMPNTSMPQLLPAFTMQMYNMYLGMVESMMSSPGFNQMMMNHFFNSMFNSGGASTNMNNTSSNSQMGMNPADMMQFISQFMPQSNTKDPESK